MRILLYDIENVISGFNVNVDEDGYFICPFCKKEYVKLEKYYYQTNDVSRYTHRGICKLCNHTFYKAL